MRVPSVRMIVTKSSGVESMTSTAKGCSAAVAAASVPAMAADDVGTRRDRAGERERQRLGLGALGGLGLDRQEHAEQRGDRDDGREKGEEDAGCRARPCRRSHAPPRVCPAETNTTTTASSRHPWPTVLAGRTPQTATWRSVKSHPIGGEDGSSDSPDPIVQTARLQLAAGQDRLGQAHLALHRGDPRGRARRDHRPALARARRRARAGRQGIRRAHQDDDRADHLLHDRRRHRLDRQGRHRRQDRRPRAAVLHGHDDVRAGDRTGRRQHHPPRPGPRHEQLDLRHVDARAEDDAGVHPRDHPDDVLLGLHRRERAAGAVHRAAGRIRPAADGPEGRADHERGQAPPGARVPHPRHDPVARAARRLRRDRGRGRQDRRGGDREPRHPDGRLLHHVRGVHLRHPRHAAVRRRADQHLQPDEVPRPRVPADRRHVVVASRRCRASSRRWSTSASRSRSSASRSRPGTRSTSTARRSTSRWRRCSSRRAWACRCRSPSRSDCWPSWSSPRRVPRESRARASPRSPAASRPTAPTWSTASASSSASTGSCRRDAR